MKALHSRLVISLSAALAINASATTRYVWLDSPTPTFPYTNWATAATNIQGAVDSAAPGDLVLVTNGVYQSGSQANSGANRVNIWKALTVQSVNGPGETLIVGYQVSGTTNGAAAIRCVYLAGGATLSGFTIANGATTGSEFGGGIRCQSLSALVTNCVIKGNAGAVGGGGVYSGTLVDCRVVGNFLLGFTSGGGAYGSILNRCVLANNRTGYRGGGAANSILTNCLLYGNYAGNYGGGSDTSTMVNCTLARNTAYYYGGGAEGGTLLNCIVYYNDLVSSVPGSSNTNHHSALLTNCCTTPMPSSGASNIDIPPSFMSLAAGDFHLAPFSPCRNAGNNAFVSSAIDLEGNPRVEGGIVDIGAYENQFQRTIRFVRLNNPAHAVPYTNWTTAAQNIQDAIDVSVADDLIAVSNGVYSTGGRAVYGFATNRVTVDRPVTIQSVNGSTVTRIAGDRIIGGSPPFGIRCVYLTNGATLIGFTLTNGAARNAGDDVLERSGGGAWCEDANAVVSDCVLIGNAASRFGGGAFRGTLDHCLFTNNAASFGAGSASNQLANCSLIRNSALYHNLNSGGGAYGSALSNCLVVANQATGGSGMGGGASSSAITHCILSNNIAERGGGLFLSAADHSLISSNRANQGGGAYSNTLVNCVLINNVATSIGGGAFRSTLLNCTVVSNAASGPVVQNSGGGVYGGTLTNCIAYYNSATVSNNFSGTTALNCCTVPLPSSGRDNITNEPVFVDLAGGNCHLQSNSPCINAGNNSYVTNSTDMDGNPRIVGGTVDIGACEFQTPSSILSYAWAQQYGLPTDGSADFTDNDTDNHNNWQEWKAGTDPTDSASVLRMTSLSNDLSGMVVEWQSTNSRTYSLERSADLASQSPFSAVASNIVGQAGMTSYTDTVATNGGPFFYRVGVQE